MLSSALAVLAVLLQRRFEVLSTCLELGTAHLNESINIGNALESINCWKDRTICGVRCGEFWKRWSLVGTSFVKENELLSSQVSGGGVISVCQCYAALGCNMLYYNQYFSVKLKLLNEMTLYISVAIILFIFLNKQSSFASKTQ